MTKRKRTNNYLQNITQKTKDRTAQIPPKTGRISSSCPFSFGHCFVCPSIYCFWLLLWYLVVIVLSVLRFTASGYSCGIFWSLYCLSFDLPLLVTPVVSRGHCIVCPSIYRFWLLLWYLTIQWPKEKGQTTIYKALHRKLKIEQHKPHQKPEGLAVPAPDLAPVVWLLNDTDIIWYGNRLYIPCYERISG
jgi:hypothetical protein